MTHYPSTRPECPIITVANHKGGCGKTTTIVNLAAEFGKMGRKVLVIDLDPQGTASKHIALPGSLDRDIYVKQVLTDPENIGLVIKSIHENTHFENVSLIAATSQKEQHGGLLDIESRLLNDEVTPASMLSYATNTLSKAFDIILIDTPPELNIFNKNAMMSATHYILPINGESIYDLYGGNDLQTYVNKLKRGNPDLSFLGVLVVRSKKDTDMGKVIPDLATSIFNKIIDIRIPDSTAVSKSAYSNKAVSDMGKTYPAYDSYQLLAKHIAKEHLNWVK